MIDFISQNQKVEIRNLKRELDQFKSGEAYLKLEAGCEKKLRALERSHKKEIVLLKKEHKADVKKLNITIKELNKEAKEKLLFTPLSSGSHANFVGTCSRSR